MQPQQRKHAYDFDFGNIELMTPEFAQMICAKMMSPHVPYQQMYFAELLRVAQTILYARENKICHGKFDWAEFRLEVADFDEFIGTFFTECYCSDSEWLFK